MKASSNAGINAATAHKRSGGWLEHCCEPGRNEQHEGKGDQLCRDIVGNVGVDRMHGLKQGERQPPFPDAVFVFIHDPGVGEVIDQHQHDEIGREPLCGVIADAAACPIRDDRPDNEIDERFGDVSHHPDDQRGAVSEHHDEGGLNLLLSSFLSPSLGLLCKDPLDDFLDGPVLYQHRSPAYRPAGARWHGGLGLRNAQRNKAVGTGRPPCLGI